MLTWLPLLSITSQYNIINLVNYILGLQCIEQLICDQTYENHEELFNQVTWIENLEFIINEIASQIQVNIYKIILKKLIGIF